MIPYTKPPVSYVDQVGLLAKRGLIVRDPVFAEKFLSQVSYYRLSAYCIPFHSTKDAFKPRTHFEDLAALYKLDEKLREVTDSVLTNLEILLRTRLTHTLANQIGPFGHYDPKNFRDALKHAEWVNGINSEAARSNETFIEHYKVTYTDFPRLPLWMASEVMSLGGLSKLYKNIVNKEREPLASEFGVHHRVMANWFHVITVIRNICAHHGRLWNRELSVRPLIPERDPRWSNLGIPTHQAVILLPIFEWLLRQGDLPLEGLDDILNVYCDIHSIRNEFSHASGLDLLHPKRFWSQLD